MALTVSVDEIVSSEGSPLLGKHESWERVRILEIAAVQNGCPFDSSRFSKEEGIPLIRIRDIGGETTEATYKGEYDRAYLVEPGDLLIGMDGDFNCARWRGPRGLLNQRVCRVQVTSDLYHPALLEYALPGYLKAVNDVTSSVTVKHLSSKTVAEFPLPLPPMAEQKRIVAEIEKQFSRLDEAVANLKRVQANLRRYESGVLAEALAGRLTGSDIGRWPIATVADAGDVLLGRRRAPEYRSSSNERKYLRVANVKDNFIDVSDLESMRFDDQHVARYELSPGDVLVSEGQSPEKLGQSAIFQGYPEPLCFQSTLHRFRANPSVTTPQFAQIVFRSHVRSGVFRSLGSITTNIGHLTLEKFKVAPFPLPSLSEQHRIVAEVDRRLSIVREVEAEADASFCRADRLRRSILQKAFSGQLVPQDPNDLPAPRPGKWFIYALECKGGSIYVGQTQDIARRWGEHATGRGAEWTGKHPPLRLVHWEEFDSEAAAVKREKDLKTGFGRKWLKRELAAGRTRQAGEPASALLERIRAGSGAAEKTCRRTGLAPPRKGPARSAGQAPPSVPSGPRGAVPANHYGVAAAILRFLEPGKEYGRAEVMAALGLTVEQWSGAIRELKDSGTVAQTGERRGARYRLAPAAGTKSRAQP